MQSKYNTVHSDRIRKGALQIQTRDKVVFNWGFVMNEYFEYDSK